MLMVLGILGIGYGFLTAPKDIQDVEAILKAEHDAHGGSHAAAPEQAHASHASHGQDTQAAASATQATTPDQSSVEDSAAVAARTFSAQTNPESLSESQAPEGSAVKRTKKAEVDPAQAHQDHLEHVLHQLQNKPWAAVYVACIFFLLLTMGVLAFYAIQYVSQAGWSPVLYRVMEAITAYLPVGSVIFFVLLLLSGFHVNHLFVWMADGITDPAHENYDYIVANKAGYLNVGFWLVRAAIFLLGWNWYRHYARQKGLDQDQASDNLNYKRVFKASAAFLVFFIVTESIMSWDWIMSIDPHWYSTLFGWYVFASFFVSGITVICLITLYLKSLGYLDFVNTSHIHDLAKFMFGISVFWTYLWFSQFMLIWYANIPEEVTYFVTRIEQYNLPFFGSVVLNFVFPVLVLINTDFKRIGWILSMAGIVILVGHYLDFFVMITPGTVGDRWFIGVTEIAALMFFLGLFMLIVFTALTKAPLLAKRNPFIEESKHFHY